MKVSVLGAGAVGCLIGGLIRRADPKVELCLMARGEHRDRIREQGGVELRGPWGSDLVPARVGDEWSDIAGSDLVLLTVKSTATDEVLRSAAPFLGAATVVSIQNGINQHVMRRYLPDSQILLGVTTANMSVNEPGCITHHLAGPTVVGPAVEGLPAGGFATTVERLWLPDMPLKWCDPITSIQYNKIALNSLSYVSSMSRSNYTLECLLQADWRHHVALPLLQEGFRILKAAGIRLKSTPGPSDVIRLRLGLRLLDLPLIRRPIERKIAKHGNPRLVFSVEQDLLKGRLTEIDYVNGELVRLAEQHQVDAPLNRLAVEIAHDLERREAPRFLDRDEMIRRFREAAGKGGGR
ncbi:MAG: ketopantoate reductase family protein [Planctomycetaceae bacterium]|nr:MAG: ketopantoate reductase family protein [Planctomycetaceae bacterium]